MYKADQRQAGKQNVWANKLSYHFPEIRDKIFHSLSGVYECGPKKWHEMPFVHGLPRFQDYVEGNVSILMPFRDAGSARDADKIPSGESFKAAVYKLNCGAARDGDRGISGASSLRNDNEHVVLIPVIDLCDEPKNFVASFVGLKVIKKELLSGREGATYRSLIDGRFHIITISTRQGVLGSVRDDGAAKAHPATIQCRTEAEDYIPGPAGEHWIDTEVPDGGHPRLRVERSASGFSIFVDHDPKGSVQIIDLLLGPSDLMEGALE